jgi:hypothetical protein
MKTATLASARTTAAARNSLNAGLQVAFRSGAVMGLVVVGLALLDISLWFCADIHSSAIGDHEDLGEIHLVAGRTVELFDEDFIIGSNTILFAARLDDCVHFIAFFIPRALWRRCKLVKQRALVPDITGFFELPEAAHGRSPGLPPKAMGGF